VAEITSTLAAYRQKLGLTQAELADRVGVTRQTIIAIEKGSYAPSVKLAIELARVFSCSVEDLFQYHA
jgi:putative transcriptional regulator